LHRSRGRSKQLPPFLPNGIQERGRGSPSRLSFKERKEKKTSTKKKSFPGSFPVTSRETKKKEKTSTSFLKKKKKRGVRKRQFKKDKKKIGFFIFYGGVREEGERSREGNRWAR